METIEATNQRYFSAEMRSDLYALRGVVLSGLNMY